MSITSRKVKAIKVKPITFFKDVDPSGITDVLEGMGISVDRTQPSTPKVSAKLRAGGGIGVNATGMYVESPGGDTVSAGNGIDIEQQEDGQKRISVKTNSSSALKCR